MNIAAEHGWLRAAAILISIGLHGSVYALLSAIERPAPAAHENAPIMAYIAPLPRFEPEPPPARVEPKELEQPIRTPPPEPERPPPAEPEPEPDPRPEPQPEATPEFEVGPDNATEPTERATQESEARPSLTRFEWYAEIPDAIARLRAAEEQKPRYREFGNLDALTAGSGTGSPYAPDAPDAPVDGVDVLPFAQWGEERVQINENCYVSRPAPGTVLAEVHRFTNPMMNCVGSAASEPQDDLFIEAKPPYLEGN